MDKIVTADCFLCFFFLIGMLINVITIIFACGGYWMLGIYMHCPAMEDSFTAFHGSCCVKYAAQY